MRSFPLLCILIFPPVVFAQLRPADLVVTNANIHTMTSRDAVAQALAVKGNRIVAIGSNTKIRKLVGRETRVIDAGGKLLLPGFNDAHVHFMGIGNTFSSMDLREVKTGTDLLERVRRYVRFIPRGRWILGSGLPLPNSPTKKDLDTASPANPFFVYHSDATSASANSLAFARAGLKDDSSGVERDPSGVATGVVSGD